MIVLVFKNLYSETLQIICFAREFSLDDRKSRPEDWLLDY